MSAFLKYCPIFLYACALASCGADPVENKNYATEATTEKQKASTETKFDPPIFISEPVKDGEETDTIDYDHATYFIVIADTHPDYWVLHKKMFALNARFNLNIDTMGRYFNEAKNLICLREDDPDDMFAGDYFPRRYPSSDLSLEYLHHYQRVAGEKTIALVTGIYEKETSADSALTILREAETNAFKIETEMYIGCIH